MREISKNCGIYGVFGQFWTILDSFEHFCAFLNIFGHFCIYCGHFHGVCDILMILRDSPILFVRISNMMKMKQLN